MRTSKYVGFLAIGLGTILIVGSAVLPVSPTSRRLGLLRIDAPADNCGPAAYVALRQPDTECGHAAGRRLLAATSVGVLVVALGMALFAGGDEAHGSRIETSTGRPRAIRSRPGYRTDHDRSRGPRARRRRASPARGRPAGVRGADPGT